MAAKACGGSAVDKPTLCDIGYAEGRGLSIGLPTGGRRLKQPVPRVQATWATWHLGGRTALGGARARCRWSPRVCSCPVALVSLTFPDLLLEVVASDYSTLFSASAPRILSYLGFWCLQPKNNYTSIQYPRGTRRLSFPELKPDHLGIWRIRCKDTSRKTVFCKPGPEICQPVLHVQPPGPGERNVCHLSQPPWVAPCDNRLSTPRRRISQLNGLQTQRGGARKPLYCLVICHPCSTGRSRCLGEENAHRGMDVSRPAGFSSPSCQDETLIKTRELTCSGLDSVQLQGLLRPFFCCCRAEAPWLPACGKSDGLRKSFTRIRIRGKKII
ncbi:uncharacterized protein LOC144231576 [Crocuta crocuta]